MRRDETTTAEATTGTEGVVEVTGGGVVGWVQTGPWTAPTEGVLEVAMLGVAPAVTGVKKVIPVTRETSEVAGGSEEAAFNAMKRPHLFFRLSYFNFSSSLFCLSN